MIFREIKSMAFFDGCGYANNCVTGNDYWLGSSDAPEYLKAHVCFFNEMHERVSMGIFERSPDALHKPLSEWKAPESGFYEEDLVYLSECFRISLKEEAGGGKSAYKAGYLLELIIKLAQNRIYFLVYSLRGGRGPESIYFHGLYDMAVADALRDKHIQPYVKLICSSGGHP